MKAGSKSLQQAFIVSIGVFLSLNDCCKQCHENAINLLLLPSFLLLSRGFPNQSFNDLSSFRAVNGVIYIVKDSLA